MKRYVRSGALAGLAGGGAMALVLRLVGEGPIGQAVAVERARPGPHQEMFSRGTQQVGGMAATLLYGLAVGTVLAVTLAAVGHRLRGDAWQRSVRLAAVAFATAFLVPFLKFPANPPAVGDPATIGRRTALYLVMLAWSLVATWAGWRGLRWLRLRGISDARALPDAVALTALVVAVGLAALPGSPDAVTAPATLIWRFRVASLAGAAAFWSVTGVVLGWLLDTGRRAHERHDHERDDRTGVTVGG